MTSSEARSAAGVTFLHVHITNLLKNRHSNGVGTVPYKKLYYILMSQSLVTLHIVDTMSICVTNQVVHMHNTAACV